jgi:hypothetical protein
LLSCSDSNSDAASATPATTTPSEGAPVTAANQGILTDIQAQGLNGANQVSDVLKQADEERKKQLDAQGK